MSKVRIPIGLGHGLARCAIQFEHGQSMLIRSELLLVDIAGFKATNFRADQPVWSTRVVVGCHYRSKKVFKAKIQRW